MQQQFVLQANVFKGFTMDSFPKALAKQSLWVTPGPPPHPHAGRSLRARWDYQALLRQRLVLALPRQQSKLVGREHIRQANTQAAHNERAQPRRRVQQPLNCCCRLSHEKEVLHFCINPGITWSRIELDGLEQSRQWMNIPSAPNSDLPTDKATGEAETLKENSYETLTGFRESLFCHLNRYEPHSCLTTKQVELRGSFPFSFSLSLCSNVNKS